jgi:hypothetical protein
MSVTHGEGIQGEEDGDTLSLPPLSGHVCNVFFPVARSKFPPEIDLTLGDIADAHRSGEAKGVANWLSPDVLETITEDRRDRKFWVRTSKSPGSDLYPHIRRLLGHNDNGADPSADDFANIHAVIYQPSESAHKLLSGKRLAYAQDVSERERQAKGLVIGLSQSARARIAARVPGFKQTALELRIRNISYLVFRTGYALMVPEIQVLGENGDAVHPYLLVEGLYSLSRFNQLTCHCADGAKAPEFSFKSMMHSLTSSPEPARDEVRAFTTAYLQFRDPPEERALRTLMIQLARHYTDDYQIHPEIGGIETVEHFENVSHLFSLEGAVTVVDLSAYQPDQAPDFLANYYSNTYKKCYLPLMTLAYHQYCFLLDATNNASTWPVSGDEEAIVERLTQIRREITNFMLCFRFTHVSRISMHNAINRAISRVLDLDRMMAELHSDTTYMDAFLRRIAAAKEAASAAATERRLKWISVVGTFGIAWLASFEIFKEVLGVEAIRDFVCLPESQVGSIAVVMGCLLGLVAAWVACARGPHKS